MTSARVHFQASNPQERHDEGRQTAAATLLREEVAEQAVLLYSAVVCCERKQLSDHREEARV